MTGYFFDGMTAVDPVEGWTAFLASLGGTSTPGGFRISSVNVGGSLAISTVPYSADAGSQPATSAASSASDRKAVSCVLVIGTSEHSGPGRPAAWSESDIFRRAVIARVIASR